MNQFPDCPRCHSESWEAIGNQDNKCASCNFKSIFDNRILLFTFSDRSWVAWYPDQNVSRYFTPNKSGSIILPYLPYDITLDKLKLYLNFL